MRYMQLGKRVLVPRYGTTTYIAAELSQNHSSGFHAEQGAVVALHDDEFKRYRREYARELRDGNLVEVDEIAYTKALEAAQKSLADAAEQRKAQNTPVDDDDAPGDDDGPGDKPATNARKRTKRAE